MQRVPPQISYHTSPCKTTQHQTTQNYTIHHNTIQYTTIQYTTIQYNTIQHNTIQYTTIQYYTIQQIASHYYNNKMHTIQNTKQHHKLIINFISNKNVIQSKTRTSLLKRRKRYFNIMKSDGNRKKIECISLNRNEFYEIEAISI